MSRKFVILHHTLPCDPLGHYDLMIENEDTKTLTTWQFDRHPSADASDIACKKIHDHRPKYLTYQGMIDKSRGYVERVDFGICDIEQAGNNKWIFSMAGQNINGKFKLLHREGDAWILIPARCKDIS